MIPFNFATQGMSSLFKKGAGCRANILPGTGLFMLALVSAAAQTIDVGVAVRDITPEVPIWLSGYAGRKRPADKIDHPLKTQALALMNGSGERFVFVALDNCEVSHFFMEPVLSELQTKYRLKPGEVSVVSSHTHSAPVLRETLKGIVQMSALEEEQVEKYSNFLQKKLVEVVGTALEDCQPATLEYGLGRATFAMNRRLFEGDAVGFGDNFDAPVDWDVPVLRVRGTNGAVRAVAFGYACHGTSIRSGDDWYAVSGDYMAYARQQIEQYQPGAVALYLTGMGADSDPSPRQTLLDARRHGLELAGAVIGVLDRPMHPVRGGFKLAYDEVELPFVGSPTREQLDQDAHSEDLHVKLRAEKYLKALDAGQPIAPSIKLPVAALRFGSDLTFVLMGGEVVVDYARRIKRTLADDHPWTVGYAYEVPCYIPSARVLKEGGYEADSSLIYYGYYGPFRGTIEGKLNEKVQALVGRVR